MHTFKLQRFRKRVYLYIHVEIYQTYSKKEQTQSQYPRKYPFKIENLPKLTSPPAKMIWSSRRDATKQPLTLN